MLKRLALYPFLFILDLVLILLAHNLGQVDPMLAIQPLLILWLAVGGFLLLFFLIFRDGQYAAYLAFLLALYSLAFGYLVRFAQDIVSNFGRILDGGVFLAISTGVLLFFTIKRVWGRLGGRTWLVQYLNLVFAIGLLFPAYEVIKGVVDLPSPGKDVTKDVETSLGEITVDCSSTPDIYYLILDGYGRADMLQDLYGLNNQPFLDYLSRQGFYIASGSYTNYTQTYYSIPSSLNFDFVNPPEGRVNGQLYISGLMRQNNIMRVLQRCGYHTIAFKSGFFFTDHPHVDLYLEPGVKLNELESLLLADSPLDILAQEVNLTISEHSYAAHRQRVLYSFAQLKTLYQIPEPKFVLAHIISPHPPFVFDQNGSPVDPPRSYYLGDGDDYQGDLNEYVQGYSAQVAFVNRQLEQVIDSILANSPQPPIIILQGDHGPGSRLVWDFPEQTCLWERTPILNAYYLPKQGQRLLYPSISPVNSFRVVLNTSFGARLPLLPDTTFFSFHNLERQAIDITTERASRENCAAP
jgi:hypothetical protein